MRTTGTALCCGPSPLVAACCTGRTVSGCGSTGLWCADQFAGARLTAAGLIVASGPTGPAQLTAAGHALLDPA